MKLLLLRDVLHDYQDFPKVEKHLDKKVIFNSAKDRPDQSDYWPWPFTYKNIKNWYLLEDMTAIAYNENPSKAPYVGFEIKKMSEFPWTEKKIRHAEKVGLENVLRFED